MVTGAGREPIVKRKARMPPSTIPPAQLQAMMADFRGDRAHSAASAEPLPGFVEPRRRVAGAFVWLMVGALLGVGVGVLGPRVEQMFAPPPAISVVEPTLMAAIPSPAPVQTPAAVAPPPAAAPTPPAPAPIAPTPIERPAAAVVTPPAPPAKSEARPVSTPQKKAAAKPASCVRGGPCGRADVQAAERRLRSAYDSARRAGVSSSALSGYRQRWERASNSARSKPRTTVGVYRSLTNELSAKAAQARARRH
jgi:hypothetical protein